MYLFLLWSSTSDHTPTLPTWPTLDAQAGRGPPTARPVDAGRSGVHASTAQPSPTRDPAHHVAFFLPRPWRLRPPLRSNSPTPAIASSSILPGEAIHRRRGEARQLSPEELSPTGLGARARRGWTTTTGAGRAPDPTAAAAAAGGRRPSTRASASPPTASPTRPRRSRRGPRRTTTMAPPPSPRLRTPSPPRPPHRVNPSLLLPALCIVNRSVAEKRELRVMFTRSNSEQLILT